MPVALTVTSDPACAPPCGSALRFSVSTGFRTDTTSEAAASGVDELEFVSQPHTSHEPALENDVLKVWENVPCTCVPLPLSELPLSALAVDAQEPPLAGRSRA